jgi:hypothetical protein
MWLVSLIIACLIWISPFLAIGLGVGYVAGRFIKDPGAAAIASGLVGLASFWGSLVTALVAYVPGDAGAGVAFVLQVLLYVAFFASPVFVALAFVIYRDRRRRLLRKQ